MNYKLFLFLGLFFLTSQAFAQNAVNFPTPLGTWKSYDAQVNGKPNDKINILNRQFFSFRNPQGNLDVIWQDQENKKIYLSKFNAGLQQQKQIPLPAPGNTNLIAATQDDQGNYYYAVYQSIENAQDILFLVKTNASGAQLLQKRQNSSPGNRDTPANLNIWDFGRFPSVMAYKNGQVALFFARRLNKSKDGLNHQSGWAVLFDAKTLNVTKNFGQTSGHSFDNFLSTNTAGEFVGIDLGDNYPRGIHLHKFATSSDRIQDRVVYSFKTYHGTKGTSPAGRPYPRYDEISTAQQTFYKWSNDNGTYTELGGVVEVSDGYLVIFAGEPDPRGKSINNARATGEKFCDARNLGFVKVRKDYENAQSLQEAIISQGISEKGTFYDFGGRSRELENHGVVWLTNFKNAETENVMHIKTLALPNGNILILYATAKSDYYGLQNYQPYMMAINSKGQKVAEPIKLPQEITFSRRDEALVLGNQVIVAQGLEASNGGKGTLRIFELALNNKGQAGNNSTTDRKPRPTPTDPKPVPNPNPSPNPNKGGVSVSRWRMHKGEGVIQLAGTGIDLKKKHGNPVAYQLAEVPQINNAGWQTLNGEINMRATTDPALKDCYQAVDFTYFVTGVDIPANTAIKSLKVKIGYVDDGARMFIYNSKYPKGKFDPAMDGRLAGRDFIVDLTKDAVAGEVNAIVIIQMDDCPERNWLTKGAVIELNGQVIPPDPTWEKKGKKIVEVGGKPEKKSGP